MFSPDYGTALGQEYVATNLEIAPAEVFEPMECIRYDMLASLMI